MRHPFDLDPSELEALQLDVVEELTDEEAANIGGGRSFTTRALGEEGGGDVTTLALGEEGGGVTTRALGEEGGVTPPEKPPIATTLALGEEGGCYLK
jgi:hypothetical protein